MFVDSVKSYSLVFVLISFAAIFNHSICVTPVMQVHDTTNSSSEINDLIQSKNFFQIFQPVHVHQDDDMLLKSNKNVSDTDITNTMAFQKSSKSDAELLEDIHIEREDPEIEEFYKGSSLIVNMDKVNDENIEMTFAKHKSDGLSAMLIIFVVTLSLISTFVTVIICRKRFAQQLGIREMFVTTNNRDYWSDQLLPSQRII